MIIRLDWPSAKLSPNARLHWRAKVGPKQDAKRRAGWAAIAAPGFAQRRDDLRAYIDPIAITVTFYPPDKRRRDRDNMIASTKAAFDGVADAFGIDDYRFHPTYKVGDPIKGGCVEIEI
jgi:crossover junction endodeoxyribonuclease RusA